MSDEIEVFGRYIRQSAKAFCLNFESIGVDWLPKSQILDGPDDDEVAVGEHYIFVIPEWLAREKGLAE